MTTAMASYKGHRYPVEIINHCVWLYFRFRSAFVRSRNLCSYAVSWSAMRRSGAGARSSGRPTPTSCAGDAHAPATSGTSTRSSLRSTASPYLWRAVDQDGNVLDVLVQSRRNAIAAKRFFRKLLKGLGYVPRVMVTDNWAATGWHTETVGVGGPRQSRYLNNRAENPINRPDNANGR